MSVHALRAYQAVDTGSRCATADKRELVVMMYDAAIDAIRLARLHAERGEKRAASAKVSHAMSVINGLRETLDLAKGGQVAEHLDDFYRFILSNLVKSAGASRPDVLPECEDLLGQVREAWTAISPGTAGHVTRHLFLIKS